MPNILVIGGIRVEKGHFLVQAPLAVLHAQKLFVQDDFEKESGARISRLLKINERYGELTLVECIHSKVEL